MLYGFLTFISPEEQGENSNFYFPWVGFLVVSSNEIPQLDYGGLHPKVWIEPVSPMQNASRKNFKHLRGKTGSLSFTRRRGCL